MQYNPLTTFLSVFLSIFFAVALFGGTGVERPIGTDPIFPYVIAICVGAIIGLLILLLMLLYGTPAEIMRRRRARKLQAQREKEAIEAAVHIPHERPKPHVRDDGTIRIEERSGPKPGY